MGFEVTLGSSLCYQRSIHTSADGNVWFSWAEIGRVDMSGMFECVQGIVGEGVCDFSGFIFRGGDDESTIFVEFHIGDFLSVKLLIIDGNNQYSTKKLYLRLEKYNFFIKNAYHNRYHRVQCFASPIFSKSLSHRRCG